MRKGLAGGSSPLEGGFSGCFPKGGGPSTYHTATALIFLLKGVIKCSNGEWTPSPNTHEALLPLVQGSLRSASFGELGHAVFPSGTSHTQQVHKVQVRRQQQLPRVRGVAVEFPSRAFTELLRVPGTHCELHFAAGKTEAQSSQVTSQGHTAGE